MLIPLVGKRSMLARKNEALIEMEDLLVTDVYCVTDVFTGTHHEVMALRRKCCESSVLSPQVADRGASPHWYIPYRKSLKLDERNSRSITTNITR